MELVYPPMTSVLYQDVISPDGLKSDRLSHPSHSTKLLTNDVKDGWLRNAQVGHELVFKDND